MHGVAYARVKQLVAAGLLARATRLQHVQRPYVAQRILMLLLLLLLLLVLSALELGFVKAALQRQRQALLQAPAQLQRCMLENPGMLDAHYL